MRLERGPSKPPEETAESDVAWVMLVSRLPRRKGWPGRRWPGRKCSTGSPGRICPARLGDHRGWGSIRSCAASWSTPRRATIPGFACAGRTARTSFTRAGLTFVHNLLSVTGDFTPQPFVDGDIVCVYNGQIYNQPFSRTDGEVLIPLYKEHGPGFASHLEGEFAIALYDFRNGLAVFATDPFKTKPLFINGIECASYRSGVGGEKAEPNEIRITNLDGKVLDRMPVRRWDLNQWKETYDDWIAAFESAVARRAKEGCFIGLSSGYDSGGIACALLIGGVNFKAYSFAGRRTGGGARGEAPPRRARTLRAGREPDSVAERPRRQRALHDRL